MRAFRVVWPEGLSKVGLAAGDESRNLDGSLGEGGTACMTENIFVCRGFSVRFSVQSVVNIVYGFCSFNHGSFFGWIFFDSYS